MRWLESKVPPPVVMLVVAAVMRAAALATPALDFTLAVSAAAAAALAVAGLVVEAAGALAFVRARTTVDPTHPRSASSLVTSGVYRFTRNPMYLGDLVMLVAWAAYLSNALALVLAPLFVAYIDRFQIRAEERALTDLFGARYTEYTSGVRRWL